MNIAILSFTTRGAHINRVLCKYLEGNGFHLSQFEEEGLENVKVSLKEWTKEVFQTNDALIFVGAIGIAVRAIAPFLVSKAQDPAVLVIDEQGQYVVPLVSGHIGGANTLAKEVGKLLEALPVITTATDVSGCFAVDEWAKAKGFILQDLKRAKDISASLLAGRTIGFGSLFDIEGSLPQGIVNLNQCSKMQVSLGIWLGITNEMPFEKTLWLVPPVITLGIGCKKGTSKAQIQKFVEGVLKKRGIPLEAIKQVASIDLKATESGLLEWVAAYKKPIKFYTSQELGEIEGSLSASLFVKQVTGVDNVCERAAIKGSAGGQLILGKTALEGVTIALAMENYRVSFSNVQNDK